MKAITLYAVGHRRACVNTNVDPSSAQDYDKRIGEYLEYFRDTVAQHGYDFRINQTSNARVFDCDDADGWHLVNYRVDDFWWWASWH